MRIAGGAALIDDIAAPSMSALAMQHASMPWPVGLERTVGAAIAHAHQGRHEQAFFILIDLRMASDFASRTLVDRDILDGAMITQFVLYAIDATLPNAGIDYELETRAAEVRRVINEIRDPAADAGATQAMTVFSATM